MKKLISPGALTLKIFLFFFSLNFLSEKVFSQPYPKGDDRNFEKNHLYIKLINSIEFPKRDFIPVGRSKNVETGIRNLDKLFRKFTVKKVKNLYKEGDFNNIPSGMKSKVKNTLLLECNGNEKSLLTELQKSPEVEYVERVPILFPFGTPDDPYYISGFQWYLDTIHIEEAWQYTEGNNGIKVAVIDFSFYTGHEDLQGKFVDAYDAVYKDTDVEPPAVSVAHGTNVAGLIGAVANNGLGVAGCGYNIKMIPIKINVDTPDANGNYNSDAQAIINAIDHAVKKGAKVINLSIGTPELSITQKNKFEMADSAGVVIVASAGNDNNNVPMYPAAFNFVISVANTSIGDIRYHTSSYGSSVDIAAPGGLDSAPRIMVCTTGSPSSYTGGNGGTSFSTPLVSATCVLMLDVNPKLTPLQVKEILQKTSVNIDALNPGFEGLLGAGRLHAGNAVKEALNYRANFSATFPHACPNQNIYFQLDYNDTGATYQWDFTGGTPPSFSGPDPSPVSYPSAGTYTISCQVTNTYGTFTISKNNFITITNSGLSLPFIEDFTGDFPGRGWSIWNPDRSYTWVPFDTVFFGTGVTQNTFLFMNNFDYPDTGAKDDVISPIISLSGESDAYLKFDVAYSRFSISYNDTLSILLTTDCGQTWNLIYKKGGSDLQTVSPSPIRFFPTIPSEWRTEVIDISAFKNNNIQLIFENKTDFSNNLFLDNIEVISSKVIPIADFKVYEKEICPTKTITVTDASTGNPNSWSWSFENGTPSTAIGPGPHKVTFNSTGNFDISLTVSNGIGSHSITKKEAHVTNGMKPGFLLDFEDGAFPPAQWNIGNSDSGITWVLDANATGNGTSTKCIKLPYFNNERKEVYDYFYSDLMDFSDAINPRFMFTNSFKQFSGAPNGGDWLFAQIGNNCSFENTPYLLDFITHYFWWGGDATLSTETGTIGSEWVPAASTQWKTIDTSLAIATGSSVNIYLGGYDGAVLGNSIYVDDIIIKADNYSPIKVTNFTLSNPANQDVKIDWSTNYEIDNSRFLIERKTGPAGSYVMIDSLDGLLNSRTLMPYQKTVVSQPADIMLYYKLSTRNIYGYKEFRALDSILISSGPDITPPVITLIGNDSITIFKGDAYNDPGATALDDIDGDITNKIVIVNNVNINIAGTYIITYNVSDISGNPAPEVTRVVIVVADVSPPVITLIGNDTVYVSESMPYNDAGATALDNRDGDITNSIVVVNAVNTNVPGTYLITYNVTDAAGNPALEVKRVVIVTAYICTLIANISNTIDVTCNNGSDGLITVTPNQGVSPYSYKWSDPSAQITATASNLSAGTYTVTVSDTKACTVTSSATLTQPNGISIAISNLTPTSCGFSNGSVTATGSGGTPGFNYAWNDPSNQKTPSIGNLAAGTYKVTVTDTKSCTATVNVTINPSGNFSLTLNSSNATCGKANGSATVVVSGGKSPFGYNWNDPYLQTTPMADSLGTGNYKVTVIDANSCLQIDSVFVSQPTMANISFDVLDASCELPNGVLTAKPAGGASPYSYKWSFNNATTQTISSLLTGSYTVTVTDVNNCTVSSYADVGESSRPQGFISGMNPSCAGVNNGSVNLTISGGTTPYSYNWTSGATTEDLSNVSTGTYSVTMTDAKGCTVFQSMILGPGVTISLSVVSTDVSCFGFNNGTASVTATGGTLPYQYSWAPVTGNTKDLINLGSGTYSVTVTDNQGCSADGSTLVSEPVAVVADFDPINRFVKSGDTVKFLNNSTGATTFKWSFGDGNVSTQTSPTHVYSGATTFTITLIAYDNNGCKSNVSTDSVLVNSTSVNFDSLIYKYIIIYPNPTRHHLDVKIPLSLRTDKMEYILLDMAGKVLIKNSVNPILQKGEIEVPTNDLPAGVYFLKLNSTLWKDVFLIGKVRD